MIGDEEKFGNANEKIIIVFTFVDLEAVNNLLRYLIQLLLERINFVDSQVCPLHDRDEKTKEGKFDWASDI